MRLSALLRFLTAMKGRIILINRILKPLIEQERELLDKNTEKGLIVVAGFSQGCGMSLHCFYECDKVDCALGIAGYLF